MTTFLIVLLVVCAIVELISLKFALDGIDYDCSVSKPIVEIDEPLELLTVVKNNRRRFIPFLRIAEDVPDTFQCESEIEVGSITLRRSKLRSSIYLMPRQKLTRRTKFWISKRGRYLFLGAELGGGDFLGFSENKEHVELMREVVVLPKSINIDALSAMPGGLLGDISVNRFIHEDPMLTLGFREYTGREPMKLISWKQTARMGELMVKNLDHTVERTATVILNVNTFAFGGYGNELIEKAYSIARGVCEELEDKRIPYAFFSNARLAGGDGATGEVGDGLGSAHIRPILEGLGRATYDWTEKVWAIIDRATRSMDAGRSCIFITPTRSDLADAEFDRIEQRTGLKPKLIVVMEVCP